MPTKTFKNNLKKITLIVSCFLFIFAAQVLAGNKILNKDPDSLTGIQEQAELYRNQGLAFQNSGDLDSALKFYQKAVELNPGYAVVYNDLGVIYEAQGDPDRAEESYLKSLSVDPNYVSAYSNLALLYEDKRDLTKAAYYWQKRVELGNPDDLWTFKAQQRLDDINLILTGKSVRKIPEKDVNSLMKDVISEKVTSGKKSSKQATAKKPQNVKLNAVDKGYSAEMQQAFEEAQKLDSKKKDTVENHKF